MTEKEALQKMWDDLILRGLSESTFKNYTRNVKKFLAFCNRPIEELDESDARQFLTHLITKKRLAPRSVNQYNSSIRFFFGIGLNRTLNYLQIPMMKVPQTLPDVLSREEINQSLNVCNNKKHKALILLGYGSGLRVGEIGNLRTKDIDSKEMRIFVKGGKNKRDHYTILSQTTLDALRDYWKEYKPNSPQGWLFPGTKNVGHITRAGIALAFDGIISKTNIKKELSTHSMRRAFATHLLEDGVDIFRIKELLGHNRIQSTMAYLRLINATEGITSPADTIDVQSTEEAYD